MTTELRRRSETLPGQTYSAGQRTVALLLLNTWRVECRRHESYRLQVAADGKPLTFRTAFDIAPAGRAAENIEDTTSKQARQTDLWVKLAGIVIVNHMDPEAFIRRQFSMLSPAEYPPFPQFLLSPQAVANYCYGLETAMREIRVAFQAMRNTFEAEVVACKDRSFKPTDEEAWALVLGSDDMQLTALFRYCMALSIKRDPAAKQPAVFAELTRRYRDAAALHYMRHADIFDAVWKNWIPAGYRRFAEAIYRQIYAM